MNCSDIKRCKQGSFKSAIRLVNYKSRVLVQCHRGFESYLYAPLRKPRGLLIDLSFKKNVPEYKTVGTGAFQ